MWPFHASIESVWLALYLLTFALHAVFVGFVLCGSAYALVRRDSLAEKIRDWLPFMLGAGITAGVAPLLFLQLLYQRRFYTANLLMGPRWGAVVPALILGFYALYVAKASVKWRRLALAVGVLCFLFVAWSWTEVHRLMLDEPAWRAMYAAGERFYAGGWLRLAMWLGCMTALFALVAAYLQPSRRLAVVAIAGIALALACALPAFADAHGWSYIALAGAAVAIAGWALDRLSLATAGTAAALVAGAVVREAPRLAYLEPSSGTDVGGLPVFVITLAFGIAIVAWVVRTVRSAPPPSH